MLVSGTRYGPYHRAAAVLATFDPSKLRPAGEPADPESELDDLFADSFPAAAAGNGRWQLDHRVRRTVLRQMGSPSAMQKALSFNLARYDDPAQEVLTAAIFQRLPPVDTQSAAQLTAMSQVVDWLAGLVPGLPSSVVLQRRYEQLTLLEPFERLAGEHFRGRHHELATLRSFVGVIDPHTSQAKLRNHIDRAELGDKPPMVIYGPGGLGKSALIARFILEHASLPEAEKFPWVYLDFDRPVLQPESPLTLLVEATRQLGVQYPHARDATDRIQANWQKRLARIDAKLPTSQRRTWESLLNDFQSLLENLRISGDPLLFVLDTFEQAQARPERVVTELFEFLRDLQVSTPQLRLLFAGRAPLPNRPLADEDPAWVPNQIALPMFGREEAQGFLESRGLPPSAAAEVAQQVTGTPLALVLAAELWRRMREEGEQGSLLAGADSDILGFTLRENEVEGILFGRILRRVRNRDVRALAYPGLVLRRITPDLIREVLARHCNVTLPSPERADELYAAMRVEVQLVEERDGALRHRPELRRIMLRLMHEAGGDARRRMDAIQRAAVDYYAGQKGSDARAEEIYHRLSLRQDEVQLNAAWERGAVDERSLFEALEELSPRERAWLKTRLPGFPKLTAVERAEADLDSWELEVAALAEDALTASDAKTALTLLSERRYRSGARYQGCSPLYLLEVKALEQLRRWQLALVSVEEGLAVARRAGNREFGLELHLCRIRIASRIGDRDRIHDSADIARWLAERQRDDLARMSMRVETTYAEALKYMHDPALPAALVRLKRHFSEAPESEVEGGPGPQLAAHAGYLLAELDPDAVWRAMRLAGLPSDAAGLRQLALALADWDRQVSINQDQVPGILARKRGIPEVGRLEENWTRFILDIGPNGVQQTLDDLLSEFRAAPPPVVSAIASLLARIANVDNIEDGATRQDSLEQTPNPSLATKASASQPYHVSNALVYRLSRALLGAFTRDELADLLEYRLEVRLEAISLQHAVLALIEWAVKKDLFVDLVLAVLNARPTDPDLRSVAAELGLTVESASDDVAAFLRASHSVWELDTWRAQLGRLEGRICRIEVAGAVSGTGFLVGQDLVLTTFTAVQPVISGAVLSEHLQIRFDFRQRPEGTLSPGTVYRLASGWLVDYSPPSPFEIDAEGTTIGTNEGLNYALLRVRGAPGSDAVGGDTVESTATERGWIGLSQLMQTLRPGSALVIVDHAQNMPLRLYMGLDAVRGYDRNGSHLRYQVESAPGSSGAPIFNADLDLVAMHQARSGGGEQVGVVLAKVAETLEARGLGRLFLKSQQPAADPGSTIEADFAGDQTSHSQLVAVLDRARQALDLGQLEASQMLYKQAVDNAAKNGDKDTEAAARLGLSQAYYIAGQPRTSLLLLQESLSLFRMVGNCGGEATTLNNLGMVYAALGDRQQALVHYEQALPLSRQEGDKSGEASILRNIGIVYAARGDWQQALAHYEQALPLSRQERDRNGEATILSNIGAVYAARHDWPQALAYHKQALDLFNKLNDRHSQARTYQQLGVIAQEQRQWQQAEQYYQEALAIFIEVSDLPSRASTYSRMGSLAQDQRQWRQAEQYHQQALAIFIEFNDRYNQAATYYQLGTVARTQLQWAQAEQYYQQALAMFAEFNDRQAQAATYHNLGIVAHRQFQWAQAEQYYQHALAIKIEFGDRYGQAITYYELGLVAQAQGQWAQAEQYYQQALAINIEFDDRYGQASTYEKLGLVAQVQGQWAQAEQYYQQALAIFADLDYHHPRAIVYHRLGLVAQAQEQWAQAEQRYQQALDIVVDLDDRHLQADAYYRLGIVAQEQRQWAQARQYLLQALEIFRNHGEQNSVGFALATLARLWRDSGDATIPGATAEIVGIATGEIEALFRQVLSANAEADP